MKVKLIAPLAVRGCLLTCAVLAQTLIAPLAHAQAFPNRPIKIVVPFPPGGSTDISTRLLAVEMSNDLGQPVVVENKAGNAGAIGIASVAKAEPDGYTLGVSGSGPTILLNLTGQNTSYDPLKDLAFVAHQVTVDFIFIANNNAPFNNMKELIARAKANPGKVSFGNSGTNSPSHLTYQMLAAAAAVNGLAVPYKGEGPLLVDVLGGQVDVGIATVPGASTSVKAGKVKAIGIAGGKRNPIFPNVGTVAEAGLQGFDSSTWQIIVAPARTPAPILARLNASINKALALQAIKEKYAGFGMTATGSTQKEAHDFVVAETEKMKRLLDSIDDKEKAKN